MSYVPRERKEGSGDYLPVFVDERLVSHSPVT
jgi:hypothetical protein